MVYENRFQGRTAIVTGGASGIGLSVAARLAREGAGVSLWDLKEDALARAKVEARATDTQALDVSDPAQVLRAMAASVAPSAASWTCS
jgi:2-dehydro-3-deoxy-L-rhamnonate dehydrogenase (NAD+)